MIESHPLYWPSEYKRTRFPAWSRFGSHTLFQARSALKEEIRRLGGKDLIISSNMRTRQDGDVYSNAKEPEDSGVAVYFKMDGNNVCLACDKWRTCWENTWAIAKTIEAMRGIDRWGVSELLNRLFLGFIAIEESAGKDWAEILGVSREASAAEIMTAYRLLSKEHHPDVGGDPEYFITIKNAYERALQEGER